MARQEQYSIGELARAADTTPRTIRYYTTEGVLPPPETNGRYARYGSEHLDRLRLISHLKLMYLPLGEIKVRIGDLSQEQVQELLVKYAGPPPQPLQVRATNYLNQPLAGSAGSQAPSLTLAAAPMGYHAPSSTRTAEQIQPCQPELFAEPQPEPAQRSTPADQNRTGAATGEQWQRLNLAPGVELHLRVPLTGETRKRVERLLCFVDELFGGT